MPCNGVIQSVAFVAVFTSDGNDFEIEPLWRPLSSFPIEDYDRNFRRLKNALEAAGWIEQDPASAADADITETPWTRGQRTVSVRNAIIEDGTRRKLGFIGVVAGDAAAPCTQGLE